MVTNYGCVFFFFNDTATTEIYTLSLHDALPISRYQGLTKEELPLTECLKDTVARFLPLWHETIAPQRKESGDRKSTRLNSSHGYISYAVFCLKKKKKKQSHTSQLNKSTHRVCAP